MRRIGVKITKSVADAAGPKALRYEIWDKAIPGFGLRVAPTGLKTFILRYRPKGSGAPKRFLKLGRYGITTVEEARTRATQALGKVAGGQDPAAEEKEQRISMTVHECADLFLDQHVLTKRKQKTIDLYQHLLNGKIIPTLGRKRLLDLSGSDVTKFHGSLKSTPTLANRAVTTLAAMYSWAADQRYVPEGTNPTRKVELFKESQRDRFLSEEELSRLGAAIRLAETEGIPYVVDERALNSKHAHKRENRVTVFSPFPCAALKLLLLTGCRLREILDLRWDQVDLQRGVLFLSDSKTGRKPVMIASAAAEILASLPRAGDYVIASSRPDRPLAGLKRPWNAIRRHAGLIGVRIHDLRHTYASVGAGSGLGLPILGGLLGHKQARTTSRYAHLADHPMRLASDLVSSKVARALGETDRNLGEAQQVRVQPLVPMKNEVIELSQPTS